MLSPSVYLFRTRVRNNSARSEIRFSDASVPGQTCAFFPCISERLSEKSEFVYRKVSSRAREYFLFFVCFYI